MIDKNKIISEFKRIKKLGFVKSNRSHNTGIGKTFEDYLGVDENNLKDPDYAGFEVKSQRQMSSSKITLFTKSPSSPKGANSILRDEYGKPDEKFPDIKALHTSIFGDKYNSYLGKYGFKLEVNKKQKRVELKICLLDNNQNIDCDVYWTFKDLKECIDKKLRALFVVLADSKYKNDNEEFHYTNAKVYYDLKFSKFLKALEKGLIQFDIRIGAYKTPGKSNFGKPHDHGSGYRIKRDDLTKIFKEVFEVS